MLFDEDRRKTRVLASSLEVKLERSLSYPFIRPPASGAVAVGRCPPFAKATTPTTTHSAADDTKPYANRDAPDIAPGPTRGLRMNSPAV
jgi:hypothetical protein